MTQHRFARSRCLAAAVSAAAGVILAMPAVAAGAVLPVLPGDAPPVPLVPATATSSAASGPASTYHSIEGFTAYSSSGRIAPGHWHSVPLAERGGLPAGGSFDAVAIVVTVSRATASTSAAVSAPGHPVTKLVTTRRRRTVSGFSVVPVGTPGAVRVRLSGGHAAVRIVVEGYDGKGSGGTTFHPLAPASLLAPHRVGAGRTLSLRVVGAPHTGLPPNGHVSAVALTVTAARPSAATTITAFPRGSASTGPPVVTAGHGRIGSGAGIVEVGPHGDVAVHNAQGHVTLSAQVEGYWTSDPTGSSYHSVGPVRLDVGTTAANAWRSVKLTGSGGLPSAGHTGAALLSITAGPTARSAYLTVTPGRVGFPSSGPVSIPAHSTVTTSLVTRLTGSDIHIYANRRMPLTVRVLGWYGDTASGLDVDAGSGDCPSSFPGGDGFAVIRATDGQPYGSSDATCFSSDVQQAALLPAAPQYYMNLADPGTSSTHWNRGGPRACRIAHDYETGCAYDYGYDAAQQAVTFGANNGMSAGSRWWVDVETANSWGSHDRGTPSHLAANAADIQGALRYLESHGYPAGVYTETSWWDRITGAPAGFSHVPVWGGGAGSAGNARANCKQVSITGGPALIAQWFTDVRHDHDIAC